MKPGKLYKISMSCPWYNNPSRSTRITNKESEILMFLKKEQERSTKGYSFEYFYFLNKKGEIIFRGTTEPEFMDAFKEI
jgi:hypothetical protein